MNLKMKTIKERGAFLIEVLLTVVILSISLTLIIQSLTSSLKASARVASYTHAILAIENAMLDLAYKKFPPGSSTNSQSNELFQVSSNIQKISSEKNIKNGKEVQLQVSWKTNQKPQKLSVTTYALEEKQTQQ